MPEQEIGGIVVVTWPNVVLFEGASGLGNRWIWEAYSSRNNKTAPDSNAAIFHFTNMHVAAPAMYGKFPTRLQGEHKWETTAKNQVKSKIFCAIFVHLRMPRWFYSTKEGEGMRKTFRILTFSFGLFAIATLIAPITFGQEKKTPDSMAAQEQPKTVTISGKVSAVSDTSVTIVDDKKAEQIIAIDTNTKITRGGKAATAAEIKADDAVTVVASKGEGNALTAITIKVG